MKKVIISFFALLLVGSLSLSCNDSNVVSVSDMTPSQILSSTPWETTGARDSSGNKVDLKDPNVINFVGYAYFKINGSFTMYNLNDTPKLKGDWSVSSDGKNRTLIGKNNQGETIFTRVVEITVLTLKEFTYRIYPDANDRTVYYDIIHTPTSHKESMLSPSDVLSFTPWETTGARDQNGMPIGLMDPSVSNFVGYAYFKPGGLFTIYGLNDILRLQGDWSVSADGKTRTLVFKNNQGDTITRVVDITILTGSEFTYRVYPDESNKSLYYDIIHTPTSHTEPVK